MKITVAIPVGPFPANKQWLPECLASVAAQTRQADEVLLIDDMAGLGMTDLKPLRIDGDRCTEGPAFMGHSGSLCVTHLERVAADRDEESAGTWWRTFARIWRSPWRLGVGAAFNAGVGLAFGDCVFMLGSDDTLEPQCLAMCEEEFHAMRGADAYYYVDLRYSDGRPDQSVPCNAAMVTKGFWRKSGGFAPESGSGAPDAALISAMMVNDPDSLVRVQSPSPLYVYRVHEGTDTAGRERWQGIILETRDILTETWTAPKWGRVV